MQYKFYTFTIIDLPFSASLMISHLLARTHRWSDAYTEKTHPLANNYTKRGKMHLFFLLSFFLSFLLASIIFLMGGEFPIAIYCLDGISSTCRYRMCDGPRPHTLSKMTFIYKHLDRDSILPPFFSFFFHFSF